jgi:hypothetical protein
VSAAAHATHGELHVVSQQKPSTQLPVTHSRQPLSLQSLPATVLQVAPCAFCVWHIPVASQYSPAAQSLSDAHPDGHVVPPLHTAGAHDGLPVYPAAAGVQVPSAVAPSAFVHTSHCPLHAVLQQTPSETKPLAHWVGLVWGCPFFDLHAPVVSQVLVDGLHESGSSAFMTLTHAPVPLVHVMHVPLQAPEQQVLSSQTPEVH